MYFFKQLSTSRFKSLCKISVKFSSTYVKYKFSSTLAPRLMGKCRGKHGPIAHSFCINTSTGLHKHINTCLNPSLTQRHMPRFVTNISIHALICRIMTQTLLHQLSLLTKWHTVKSNISCTLVGNLIVCWSLRCSWSIACRRCFNYIILGLTPDFNILHKDNCKPRRETFKLWNSVCLIWEILR